MIDRIKSLIYSYESGRSGLNIYDLAYMLKDIAEDKLKEETK